MVHVTVVSTAQTMQSAVSNVLQLQFYGMNW